MIYTFVKSIFNKSIRGLSHKVSGKPCQDYSISYEDDGIAIAIVCDGHGGNSHFRSEIGARLAAEITLDQLKGFSCCIPLEMFAGKELAMPAKPKRNPFIDSDGNRVRYEDLNETQQKYALQAQAYIESEGKHKEQQRCIEDLLHHIYEEWTNQIHKHEMSFPFDKRERSFLNGQTIDKAYGCTLLAFLKTKDYWLSFHIGDGKILTCDSSLVWKMPVPEDCTCFLNYTTSLCDSDPLSEFRYAFSGIGDSPVAVMLCSDGVDGSLRTAENLEDFYEQIIGLSLDGDDINNELSCYLPTLSENGNKDDISIAGYVDLSSIDVDNLRRDIEKKKKIREIHSEYRTRKSEIESINEKIDNLKIKYERHKDLRFEKQTELENINQIVSDKKKELVTLEQSVASLKEEINELREVLKIKKYEFDNWWFTAKNKLADNESELKNNDRHDEDNPSQEYTNW